MRNSKLLQHLSLVLSAALIIAGCGGGGGGGTSVAGIDRLGVSTGAVTGFGSIFVNGDEKETDLAEFDINDDGTGSSQDDLAVGDVVVVVFDPADPNNALFVISDEAVEGPISSINPTAGIIVAAGQTVLVDANTSFDDSIATGSLAGLQVGDFVEVSGFIDGDGAIRATRIEFGQGEAEVHGVVSGLNTNSLTFMINALLVDYGTAIIDDDFPGNTFGNGDQVEVKGAVNGAGILVATKVEPDGFGIGEGGDDKIGDLGEIEEAEVEGFITRFTSSTDFDVAGFPVRTNNNTLFEGGTANDLGLNVKVEVEGSVNNNNILIASKVDIRRSNNLRVTALVDSVDAGNNRLTLLGIEVRVDNQTRLEDKSDVDVEPFNLLDLRTGDYVEVRGGTDAGSSADLLALILERDDVPNIPGEDTELRGFIDAVNRPFLTVTGVMVDTTGAAFRNLAGQLISADAFFSAVQVGDLVDVDGTELGGASMSADEVQFED